MKPISKLNPTIKQVLTLADYMYVFHHIEDKLPETTLQKIKEIYENTQDPTSIDQCLNNYFFPDDQKIDYFAKLAETHKPDNDVLVWYLKRKLDKNSYLSLVLHSPLMEKNDFISAYFIHPILLGEYSVEQIQKLARERADLLSANNRIRYEEQIRSLISLFKKEKTDKILPWLNLETLSEKVEIIRRVMNDSSANIPKKVFENYPLLKSYMERYEFKDPEGKLNAYFSEYRLLKLKNTVTPEFYKKAGADETLSILSTIPYRDNIIQQYSKNSKVCLIYADALGAEYIPMISNIVKDRNIATLLECHVGKSKLPTKTSENPINGFLDRINKISAIDDIAHNGNFNSDKNSYENNIAAVLDAIDNRIISAIVSCLSKYDKVTYLSKYDKVILTADHGTSRLAICAYNQDLTKTIQFDSKPPVEAWRYMARPQKERKPENVVETSDSKYWVIKGYDRFSKSGGQENEIHGGYTLEEILVPIMIFGHPADVILPEVENDANEITNNLEIIENDDFDL